MASLTGQDHIVDPGHGEPHDGHGHLPVDGQGGQNQSHGPDHGLEIGVIQDHVQGRGLDPVAAQGLDRIPDHLAQDPAQDLDPIHALEAGTYTSSFVYIYMYVYVLGN